MKSELKIKIAKITSRPDLSFEPIVLNLNGEKNLSFVIVIKSFKLIPFIRSKRGSILEELHDIPLLTQGLISNVASIL